MFTLLSSFCIWTINLTYISQLMSNNIISCCKSHSELCPLKTATAETSWEFLYRFYQCFPHYTLCNEYIYIYIYIYIQELYICITSIFHPHIFHPNICILRRFDNNILNLKQELQNYFRKMINIGKSNLQFQNSKKRNYNIIIYLNQEEL